MNSLLKRQLKKHFGNAAPIPGEWSQFLDAVSQAYDQFDDDRKLLERSLEISSSELAQSNAQLQQAFESTRSVLEKTVAERTRELQATNESLKQEMVRRQQEAATLAETSNLLETLLKNTTDFVYFKDRKSRFVRFSDAYKDRFHLSHPDELIGKTDFDFFIEADARRKFNDEQKIIFTGQSLFNMEEKGTYRDGRVLWVLSSKMPWYDKDGNIIGIMGISKNISKRKQIEETLVETSAMLETLLKNTTDFIYFKDRESRFVRYSHSHVKHFHLTHPDELKGKTDFDFFTDEHARGAFEDEQEIIRTGKAIVNKEEKGIHQDGRTSWGITTKMPWRDKDGEIIGIWGISRDITELKQAQQEAAREQERLKFIFESVPIGICLNVERGDGSKMLRLINDAHLRISGITREQERKGGAELWRRISHPDDRAAQTALREQLDAGKIDRYSLDKRYVWPNGEIVWVMFSLQRRKYEDGSVEDLTTVVDITELKKAQEVMAQEQARLKFIFDSVPVGISLAVIQPDGREKSRLINDAHVRICGLTPEEQTKRENFLRITPPEDQERQKALSKEIVEGKAGRYSCDKRYLRPNGEVVWVMFSFQRRDCGNGCFEDLSTLVDITERKRTEEALLETSDLLETLLKNTSDIIYFKDRQCRFVRFSRAMLGHFRLTHPDELTGKTDFDIFTQEHANPAYEVEQQIIRTDQPILNLEEKETHQDGRVTWVLTSKMPWHDKEGKVIGVWGVSKDITERKRAEAELLWKTAFLEALVNSSNDGCLVVDDKGRKFLQNQRMIDLWKIPQHIADDPDNAKQIQFAVARNINPPQAIERITRILNHPHESSHSEIELNDGVFLDGYSYPCIGKDGTLYGRIWTFRDITERKRAEEEVRRLNSELEQRVVERTAELARSEHHYRLLFETMLQGVVYQDASGRIISMNPAASRILGKTSEELLGHMSTDEEMPTVHEDGSSFPSMEHPAMVALQTGRKVADVIMGVYNALDQGYRWIEVSAVPLFRDGEDKPYQVYTLFDDVTTRKHVEVQLKTLNEELMANAERLRLSQLVSGFGVFEWDIVHNVIHWSPELEALYGLPKGGFKGKYENWAAAVHPEDLPEAEAQVKKSLETGFLDAEWRALWPDGSEHWLVGRAWVDKDDQGHPQRMLGINIDINALKQAEEKTRKLNESLKWRTEQLEVTNKELEAFSYSVSHDLRAPLRSIDGFSRILLEDYADKLDEEGKESLQTVRAASQRMGHLIDDMLQLSRLTRSEVHHVPVNLSALARHVVDELQKTAPERSVKFVCEPDLTAQADSQLMRIALENLLGNAWKFTGKQPSARIEFGRTIHEGVPVYFVRDNGAGFNMAYSDKLFGAFQRLHSTTEFPGTGIGLATVQRVIHRHGGKVWAESQVGHGATFYFTLPNERKAL